MKYIDRFDSLIQYHVNKIFPECDWKLIKAQMIQESSADPNVVSPVGAMGLMQIMPDTAKELGLLLPYEIEENLIAAISYLRIQYTHFPEIPDHEEKLKFALASYNGGRGYVNKALALGYEYEYREPMPKGHKRAKPGYWQQWRFSKEKLKSAQCVVRGKQPDHKQMTEYVEKIWEKYRSRK